jgi:hypothetical protein
MTAATMSVVPPLRDFVSAAIESALKQVRYVQPFGFSVKPSLAIGTVMPAGTEAAIELMAMSVVERFVMPAISSGTREAFMEFAATNLNEFTRSMDAIAQLVRTVVSPSLYASAMRENTASVIEQIRADALALAGEGAPAEIDFCVQTFENALGLVSYLGDAQPRAEDVAEDQKLAATYNAGAGFYFFGMTSICALSALKEADEEVIAAVFEATRYGALTAYISAEQAIALRATEQLSLHSVDEDCAFTAGELDAIDAA